MPPANSDSDRDRHWAALMRLENIARLEQLDTYYQAPRSHRAEQDTVLKTNPDHTRFWETLTHLQTALRDLKHEALQPNARNAIARELDADVNALQRDLLAQLGAPALNLEEVRRASAIDPAAPEPDAPAAPGPDVLVITDASAATYRARRKGFVVYTKRRAPFGSEAYHELYYVQADGHWSPDVARAHIWAREDREAAALFAARMRLAHSADFPSVSTSDTCTTWKVLEDEWAAIVARAEAEEAATQSPARAEVLTDLLPDRTHYLCCDFRDCGGALKDKIVYLTREGQWTLSVGDAGLWPSQDAAAIAGARARGNTKYLFGTRWCGERAFVREPNAHEWAAIVLEHEHRAVEAAKAAAAAEAAASPAADAADPQDAPAPTQEGAAPDAVSR